jgi:hypothetical protein|tara:strand:- start:97 stop:240 length:144 start_codon:yes stop_codon:yes gene_type:complete
MKTTEKDYIISLIEKEVKEKSKIIKDAKLKMEYIGKNNILISKIKTL